MPKYLSDEEVFGSSGAAASQYLDESEVFGTGQTEAPAKKRGITGVAADLAKGIGGSAVSAVGMVPTAIGRMVQEGGEKLFGLSMDEAKRMADAEGAPDKALEWYEKSNRLNPISIIGRGIQGGGEWIGEQGEKLRDARSDQAKEKARQSTPDGDITKPSTWTMGEDPSIEGVLQVGADVVGSMAPPIAAAIATRGRSAATQMRAGGAVVAGQIGGAAMGEAGEYLGQFSDEQLRQASPVFRKLEADGYSAADARTLVQREAENTAAAFAAPVGYVGGKATAALLGKPGEKLAGGLGSTAAKAGVLAVLGATEEGLQEVAEGVATRAGINKAAGTSRSLTEGTFGEFVLGAKAGGVTGAGKGLLEGLRGGRDQAPAVDPVPLPGAPPAPNAPAPSQEPSAADPVNEPAPESQPDQAGAGPAVDAAARLAELELLADARELSEAERQEAAGLFQVLQAEEDADNQGPANVQDPTQAPAPDVEPEATGAEGAPALGSGAAIAGGVSAEAGAGGLEAAGVSPRENVVGQAIQAAQRVLQDGGTEADANRAATDALISGMGQAPDIEIAQDAPAAVQAARAAVESAPILPPLQTGPDVNLQNRDRGRAASVVQMTDIARNPDYMRLGPSRTPDSGAPMVFAVGDDTAAIPPENFGREDVAVMSDGQQVGFRYAVADASKVNPSNFADGRTNEAFNSDLPGTIKALNNGRTAGVRAAHEMGTAGQYVEAMQGDAQMHGISPDVIARTPNPILVRVYADGDNTAGMAAKSQGQGLGMSPSELARQDAPLMDASVLGVYQPGDVTSAANRDFVRAFVGKLQGAGQDVAAMMTGNGELSQDGRKRIQAALMQAAYGDADLVDEMFDSTDTDIKAIGEALKAAAGEWANMRDSARLGAISPDADVTENLLQALGLIRKARRDRSALTDLVNQPDLLTGRAPDPITVSVLRMFYSGQYFTRAVGRDTLVKTLSDYVRGAMQTSAEPGMFGDDVTVDQLLGSIGNTLNGEQDAQTQSQNSGAASAGGRPGGGDATQGERAERGPIAAPRSPGPDRSGKEEPAENPDQAEQQNGQSDQGRAEGEGEGARGAVKRSRPEPFERPSEAEQQAARDLLKVGMVLKSSKTADSIDAVITAIKLPDEEDGRFQTTLNNRDNGVPRRPKGNGGTSYIAEWFMRDGALYTYSTWDKPVMWSVVEGGEKPAAAPKPKPKAQKPGKPAEPRTLLDTGRASDGQPIEAGDVFNTVSGRKTTGYPKQKGERFASQWLINNAILEAESRGDGMNMAVFSGEKPLKDGRLAPASRDSLLMYLFGEQPAVVPSILKPLAGRTDATPSAPSTSQGKPKKPGTKAVDTSAALADYFAPGNIVQSYDGTDEVLSYTPSEGGGFVVRVHEVRKVGGEWVRVGKPQDARVHSTNPEPRQLASGPVERLGYKPAGDVRYTEPRADGKPFPNAVDRGQAPSTPQDFMRTPGGELDFGEITPDMSKAMRRQAGKIRLTRGVQNADGTGYGLAHIEANHGDQIRALGFSSIEEFVVHVAGGIQQVWQVPGNSQLLVTAKDGRKDVMFIRLEIAKDGDFYRVNSAFPVRQPDYEARRGMKKIWDGSEPTSAVTGQRPAFATAANAAPDAGSSQGSPNASGQDSSVPPQDSDSQADSANGQDAAARAKLEQDFRVYPVQILNNLLERGDVGKLYKAAGVKGANAFDGLPMDDKAAAYVKYVAQGGKPVSGLPQDYNAWAQGQERDAEVRLLQSERTVRQANGKPFKTKISAQQFQERFDLTGTHEVVQAPEGFELRQLSPAAQAELKRKADGRESYIEAQEAVAAEMGLGTNADGEWDATEAQFDEMERRTQARLSGEPAEMVLSAPTQADIEAQQERAEQAERDRVAADKVAAAREAKERERADVKRLSESAADTFELGGDAMANLTGQKDIFGAAETEPAPTDSEKQKAADDLKNALGDLADIFGKDFKANMLPEQEQKLLPVLTRVMDAAFRLGYLSFKDAAKYALDQIRAALGQPVADAISLEHLQGAYIGMSGRYKEQGADNVRTVSSTEDKAEIEKHTARVATPKEKSNVPSADGRVERNSPEPAAEPAVGDAVSPGARSAADGAGPSGGPASGAGGRGQRDGAGLPAGGTAAGGNRGDFGLPGGNAPVVSADSLARDQFGERSGGLGFDGVPPEPVPAAQVDAVAQGGNEQLSKEQRQRAAQKVLVKLGDIENIRATLPYLLEGQQDDVRMAEAQFAKPEGYGMLFTNGTGTGKTFSGLGIVKRFERQGKTNTLIVVPDDKIAADWMKSGAPLSLPISKLADTKTAGKGIVVTTYANLGANDELARRDWDLVVADEAHTLMQSADGKVTSYLENLRAITLHPDGASSRWAMLNREDIAALRELNDRIDANDKILSNPDTMDAMVASLRKENERLQDQRAALNLKLNDARDAIKADVEARQGLKRTRLVALSATPFAYEFTIDWANGYLFDYNEGRPSEKNTFRGYNEGSNREQFFMQHFGYSMRTNKLTKPDPSKVDTGMLQRQFNGYLKKRGSLSGRMLDVQADYDRRFVLVESAIGNDIDAALSWVSEQARAAGKGEGGFSMLRQVLDDKFDYLSRRYLLEAIKATESVAIVKQHLAMGRKVVVFHDYKKGGGFNPFDLQPLGAGQTDPSMDPQTAADLAQRREQFNAAVKAFRAKFKGLVDAPLGRMASPIEVFKREFADVLLINGDEKKRDLLERYDRFQDDASGPLVALVQSDKNKGWSGHDTTGKHQRVLINLGQPTAPTRAIQQEGRIYRTGQVSNAIMRYLNTGTNWEKWAFATTIAGRASTAENLGMGELSRALKDSFIAAFEESDAYPPGHEGEGTGGKERDKAQNNALSAWDRAKTFYWATQKKNSRTKAREGVDYFATPEPVGLKMVEWLGLRGGEDSLEPSAGHGAIARWLPETSNRTVIEPSDTLRARLAMAMDAGKDRIIDDMFENHNVVNKYDGIAMNPPFGVGGKTAIEHLAKAATHLRDGGRIVALIPTGPAADKRFEKWMYEKEQRPVKPLGTVLVDGKETPIYKGDTVESRASWAPAGTVVGWRDGGVLVKASAPEFRGVAASLVSVESIKSVQPTGARTEGFSPAAGLYLVADIQMPASTFERAGTAVMTRIVVIEKQLDAARAPNQRNRDLSDIEDINALFDRLEDLSLPPRAMTASQETSAKAEQAAEDARAKKDQPKAPKEPKAAKAPKAAPAAPGSRITLGGKEYTVEVYTTNGGKDLSGVWVATRAEALSYGPSTFEKRGKGFFVRERDFKGASSPGAAGDEPVGGVFSTTAQKPAQSVTVQRAQEIADTIYNDLGIGAKSRAKVFGNPVDAGFRVPASVVPQGATRNGDVFLFAENLADELAVFGTVFHELFHLGLSKSVSQGAYIQTMLGFLSDPLVRQYAQRWKQSEDGVSRKTTMPMGNWQALAVEEALSDIAEEMNVLRGGMGTKYGNWVSSMAALMARLATRMRLKGVAERIRAMTRTQAEAFVQATMRRAGSTDPVQLRDTRFASQTLGGGTPTPPPGPPSTWQKLKARVNELTSPQALDSLVYEYQDKLVDLKRIRQHIKDIGGTITDLNDAYLGEELYHKRVAKRTQDFLADELKPLQADMRARGVSMEAFERFLHARHAPEANAALAERNPSQTTIDTAKAAADAQVRSLERLLQTATRAGTATKALTQALEQARAERARWTGAQAFKGTEAERLSLSGMSDQEATSLMTGLSPRERADLDALAARVDAMNAATMSTLERYGLMDRPSLDAWRKAYQFYVPLHRDEAHPDSTSHPIGQGFSTKGEASKRRTGSNAKVTNILGHIAMQREAALTRGEKNMVAKKLYLMAAQNPDPALWSVDKPPTVKTVDRETGLVRTNIDPTFKNKPNVVMVRIAGKDASITFNEQNPNAVRLAESIKNQDVGDLDAFSNIMAKGTRWLASVNTQYNPIFGLVNFTRDVQGAALQLSSTPIAGQERRVIADTPKALRAIYGEVRKRRGGAAAGTDPWVKLWEELQNEGGTTGYRELFMKPEERVKELEKQLNALDRGQVSQAAHAVVDWLSDFNEAIENGVRLATYKAALDQGLSKPRAASIAKNITVNFNRRGRQTAKLGAYYAFLNAAIQGTTRMVETLKGPAGKKIMLGGVMLGALNTLLGIVMMGGDDEDDEDNWEKIPDFVKERNVIIPLGREDYLTIPMPLGFNVLPNIGRKAVEMMLHDDPTASRGSHIGDLMRIVLDSFNPFGGSENLGQMAAPTVFDPAIALMQNRDWTGRQIYREDMSSLDPTPGFTRTKDSASSFSKGVAEALNKITGGTDYQPGAISWTPDQIDYVIGQLTGGIGREAMKVEQTLTAPITGEELPAYKIPILGRLYGNTSGPANHSEKFYENVRQLNMVENEIRGRAGDGEDVDDYLQKEPLAPLVGVGNAAESQLRKLRAARRAIIARGLDGYTDQVQELNEMQGQVMQDLNRQVRDAKRAAQ